MKVSETKSELHKIKGFIIKKIKKVNSGLGQGLRKGISYCDISEVFFTTHSSLTFLPTLYINA